MKQIKRKTAAAIVMTRVVILVMTAVTLVLLRVPIRVLGATNDSWQEDGKMTIILDPMYNGQNSGGVVVYEGKTYYTSAINYALAAAMKEELEKYDDVEVLLSRTKDEKVSLQNRKNFIDSHREADFFITTWVDSSGTGKASGLRADVYKKGDYDSTEDKIGQESALVGEHMQQVISAVTGLPISKRPIGKDYWAVTTAAQNAAIPNLYFCFGDLSNEEELKLYWSDPEKVKQLGIIAARGFATAYGLKREDNILTIVLDPGHGGNEFGAVCTWDNITYHEKDINLKIAQYLRTLLNQYEDVQVFLTREDDKLVGLLQRTKFAQGNLADVLISVHNNASEYHTAHGCMVLVTSTRWQPSHTPLNLYQTSEELALSFLARWQALGIDLSQDLNTKSDGILRRLHPEETEQVRYPNGDIKDYYAIVRNGVEAGLPSIILEHAYVDYESDFKTYLMTEDQLRILAQADCEAIVKYYSLQKKKS
ncbi:MAG: hypothetical protein E7256_00670 [Lachnospiraceae bacterium]|nr:hypothetical protein [Lachnospiraceae bacterium]